MKLFYPTLLLLTLSAHGQLINHAPSTTTLLNTTSLGYRETTASVLESRPDSILIVGMGASLERLFLEDLGNELTSRMAKKKVVATYRFLGKDAIAGGKAFKSIDKSGYKAVLLFALEDTGTLQIKHYKEYLISWTTPPIIIPHDKSTHRHEYLQTFNFVLMKLDIDMTTIWSALVDINCNPAKNKGAAGVAEEVMVSMKEHGYIK